MIMQPYPLWIRLDGAAEASLVLGWDTDEHGDMRPMVMLDDEGLTVIYRVGVDDRWTIVGPVAP